MNRGVQRGLLKGVGGQAGLKRGIRPYPIYGACAQHNFSGATLNSQIERANGCVNFEADDLFIVLTARDQGSTENASAGLQLKTYTPSVGGGWFPIAGTFPSTVYGHRWVPNAGDLALPTSALSVTTTTVTGCASAAAAFRGVGSIQELKQSTISAGDITLGPMAVDKDGSLAVIAIMHHTQGGVIATFLSGTIEFNLSPGKWQHIATAGRFYPTCGIYCLPVDKGTIPATLIDNTNAYHGARTGTAVLFILQPKDPLRDLTPGLS